MSEPKVITMGCRLNAFESEIIREHLYSAGLDNTIVINTCAVTAEAERQARQIIRRTRRKNPSAKVIVTGCAAQLCPDKYTAMPEIDGVLGNIEKLNLESFRVDQHEPNLVSDIMSVREIVPHFVQGLDGRARSFIQIQQGCDHRCTFCIIPFARGPNRSVSLDHLTDQVRTLVSEGYREAVLTGVDICSYGNDLPGAPKLGGIVRILLERVPELLRLRLSSLDPATIDNTLFELLEHEPRFMPHIHLSLQAMDDLVLKRMKRRHSRGGAVAIVERLRRARSDVAIGADLIAGFPTETEKMFRNTLAAVDELSLSHLHVFPYSARKGTPAERMPKVDGGVVRTRAAKLRAAGAKAMSKYQKQFIGQTLDILVEKPRVGYSPHFLSVNVNDDIEVGQIVPVRISEVSQEGLIGTVDGEDA